MAEVPTLTCPAGHVNVATENAAVCADCGQKLSMLCSSGHRSPITAKFCPVCGVAVGVDDTVKNTKAVNLRCLEGVEWGDIETWKSKGSSFKPLYVVPK